MKLATKQDNKYGLGIYNGKYNRNTYFQYYGLYKTYVGYSLKASGFIL
ncbi:hypothetical protein [Tenacibaculum sp. SZ-18]|nr:hypothetical protein [Tenacibaculum sp. SZ-18]